jgi:class 3 adenylate cyclase
MSALARIFRAFDDRLVAFQTLTQIRIFGETYMCAAGLFSDNENTAAEELVDFGQNCIDILEDLNVKMYTTYTVQAGINTGGPIVAGILGQGKALFDIFGKAVGFGYELSRTAPQNSVQLSEATFGRLPPATYTSTKRTLSIGGVDHVTHLVKNVGSSSSAAGPYK